MKAGLYKSQTHSPKTAKKKLGTRGHEDGYMGRLHFPEGVGGRCYSSMLMERKQRLKETVFSIHFTTHDGK